MPLMTVADLEADSKIARRTWREWIRTGKIATVRAGRTVRGDESDYREFLGRCRVPAKEESHD